MPRFTVVPASYVIMRRGDEVLLQLRQNTGYMDGHWSCSAAGHVEAGESVFEAGAREAFEELGVAISPADLEPVCTLHRTQEPHDEVSERADFFFVTTRWTGSPQIAEPTKAAALDWFPLDDLPTPLVPHEQAVLDMLRTGNVQPVLAFGF